MNETKTRLYLIDLLKIMTLLAIAILHANEFVFYKNIFPLGKSAPIWHLMSYYARVFTLGGQVLVAIIYFLFGLSAKTKKKMIYISIFALFGQLILNAVFQSFEWDIYLYIACSNLFIVSNSFTFKKSIWTLIVALIVLFIPSSYFQQLTPDNNLWAILTGKITADNSGAWPLLPWFFHSLLFYQLGIFVKDNINIFSTISKKESIVWIALGIISLPFLGHYYWVPIGPNYYDFVFNQSPIVYWANILPFLFIMRLALIKKVQDFVSSKKILSSVHHLFWIKHLGLTYLLSILYLGIGMQFSHLFTNKPHIFDLFFIGIMPMSELISRTLVSTYKAFILRIRK